MKKITAILFLLFVTFNTFSQKQTAFWYFGERAGLDFNSGSPIALSDSQMTTHEGCATISNFDGELLFYTSGVIVWNRNHEIMLNGQNLNGNSSSTNSAIVIPKPGDDNTYYIFTVDDFGGANGLQYSEVNMLLDGGLGGVTSNKNNVLHTPTTEKITAVKHQNDVDWWVLSHRWNSNDFVAYRVSNSGISNPVFSKIGTNVTGRGSNSVGAMKFSPNGKKIAIVHSYDNNHVQLFDFNDSTGEVTNPITLTGFNGTTGAYGVEFSIDSKLLYVTDSDGSIYQYNTELASPNDIINSRIEIANAISGLGAIQIAPNGKIYAAKENSDYLGVISNPNIIGLGSNYVENGIFLNGGRSQLGLPPFIQSFFWKEITAEFTCFGETTQFSIVDPEVSQIWDFDDAASGSINNTSTSTNPTHTFTAPGGYSVEVESTNFLGKTSITIINVTISEVPIASIPTDYILCDDNMDGDSQNGIVQSFLLSSKDNEILGSLDINQFKVSYFEDSNLMLQIPKNVEYENIVASNQLIYAKVFNQDDDTCFDLVQFSLIINDIPKYDVEDEKTVCSDNLPDEIRIENPQGTYDYEWTLEDGTIISTDESITFNTIDFIPNEGMTITVTATEPLNNCSLSTPIFVQKFETATLTQDDIIVDDFSDNNMITISPKDLNFNVDDYLFALDNGFGGIGPFQDEAIFENVAPGIRTIYIKDKFGCGGTEVEVSVIGFRKFFTPNNDGHNDTWQILGVNENFYASSIIRIFDRYGKLLSKVDPTSAGWDGYYNGQKLPATDYWFTAQIIDQDGNVRDSKGHFSLVRR